MKVLLVLLVAPASAHAGRHSDNPVQKVLELLSSLQAKIIKEGEAAQKVYDEFSEYCEEAAANLQYAIKTNKAEIEDLNAVITKATSTSEAMTSKIEELSSSIATDEADLKAATDIRQKEQAVFTSEEAELVDAIDTLGRAITILERELAKGAASFVQLKTAQNLAQALSALVEAGGFSSKDASKLTAFVQSNQQAEDADDDMGAPDPAAYKSHSGGIVEILEGLLEKAEDELAEKRKVEANAQHNFDMVKLSIEDALKVSNKEMAESKKSKAEADQTKATAEGDLAVTSKTLAEDMKTLGGLHQDCMTKATDFEAEMASRGEELKALAEAKKIIASATEGAEGLTYDLAQTSFLQISVASQIATRQDLANFEAVTLLRNLAKKEHSEALAQLASRVSSLLHRGGSKDDVFAKVKALIGDMIERLLKEAEEDASHKAYCDKEMSETKTKKADLEADLEKLNSKLDQMSAESAKLKEEVATLQKELAELAKSQAEMDKIRSDEKAAYARDSAEMEEGLEGIKMALKILREYYGKEDKAHTAAEGASSGIIGMLEVIESDFSKGIAEMKTAEDSAQAEYEKETQANEIAKTLKEQDVKYKTKEFKGLDKSIVETTSDKEGKDAELATVMEYYDKLKPICIAEPETYEERKARREAEIAGLKEALQILEGEAVFFQKKLKTLRGSRH